jgi:hypothetical protein
MAFDKPDAPGRDSDAPQFDPAAHIGDLLVVQVTGIQEGVETEYGARDVIVADVHVISRDATISATYEEAWMFGTVLYSQLKKKKGRTVLGVLEQGEKRPGKKPPWRLADPSDAQEAVALRAMTSKPDAPETVATMTLPAAPAQPATVGAGKAPWE